MIKATKSAVPSPFKLFTVFMLLLVVIILGGVCYFLAQKNYIVQNEQHKLMAIADFRVAQIVWWRNERLNHIDYIYNNPLFSRLAKAFFENPDNAEKKQDIAAWMQSLQVRGLFAEVYLFDAKGRKVLSSKNAGEVGVHAKELIAQALVNRIPVFSDLHTVPNVNFPHFDIVIPLVLPENPKSVTGILFMRMNPRSGLSERIQSWPTPSLTAETFLIRRDEDSVLFLSDLRFRQDTALKFRIPLNDDKIVVVKAVNGAEGILNGVDYRGVSVLAVARKIPDTPWIMVAKIDKKEIYGSLREQAWIAGTGMFLLIIVTAAGVRFWWWRQCTRFYLELYEERKHSEVKVRQLASVVENSNDAIFTMTLDGIITSWNKGAELSFGYEESEIFGKPIALLMDNQKDAAAFLKKIKAGERIEYYEAVYRRKDGNNVNLSLSISPVMDSAGKVVGVSFIGRDVTDTRRMEEKLHKSEEDYRALFESSRDAIMMLDRSGFLDCNKATLNLFDFSSKEQFIKKHPGELSTANQPDGQDSLTAASKHIETAYKNGTDFFEWIHTRRDGSSFHAEVLLSRMEYQGNIVLQGTVRDITGRIRIENELLQHREQLEEQVRERTAQLSNANQALLDEIAARKLTEEAAARAAQEWQITFDNISDAVALLAEDGRILKCNAAMEKMFSKTSAEIIGHHCFEIVHGTSEAVENCPFIRASRSLRRESMELSLGGRCFAVLVDPLLDSQGKFTGAVHIIADITEHKKIA